VDVAEVDSVARLIDGLRGGEDEVIRRLWDRYFARLVRLAGARLPRDRRRASDEEDVALSAFNSFCDRAARGQFPRLADRDDLWRLLSTITTRKVLETLRSQGRQKRGGGRVVGESGAGDGDGGDGLARFLGREPTPDQAAQFADECDRLFARLDDPVLRTVALRRLEGFSSEEIAAELNVSARTVDRKLGLVRAVWSEATA
jgi:DNA-directed RNA polymerase specialized sigma24 family protein